MNDPVLLIAACIVLAMFVGTIALGFYGLICVTTQCVRHCQKIWKLHKRGRA